MRFERRRAADVLGKRDRKFEVGLNGREPLAREHFELRIRSVSVGARLSSGCQALVQMQGSF
jgi:hypothetical protein